MPREVSAVEPLHSYKKRSKVREVTVYGIYPIS